MIPEIGILIAGYVFTRMWIVLTASVGGETRRALRTLTQVFAAIVMFVAVMVAFDLLLRGTTGLNVGDLK